MKSTQNHLTLALTKSRVMGVGQGTSLPSWELVSEHNRIEPLPAATGRGSGRRVNDGHR